MKISKKESQLVDIQQLLVNFFNNYLNENYLNYCQKLCKRLKRRKKLNVARGKAEIWAASIVFVIARVNFLFDKESKNFITPDTVCDFFKTKKHTTSNKASEIQKVCKIEFGDEELCDAVISDALSFVQLDNGLIVSKSTFVKEKIRLGIATEEEEKEMQASMEEQRRFQEEKEKRRLEIKEEKKLQAEEEKRKKEAKYQPSLFDDL